MSVHLMFGFRACKSLPSHPPPVPVVPPTQIRSLSPDPIRSAWLQDGGSRGSQSKSGGVLFTAAVAVCGPGDPIAQFLWARGFSRTVPLPFRLSEKQNQSNAQQVQPPPLTGASSAPRFSPSGARFPQPAAGFRSRLPWRPPVRLRARAPVHAARRPAPPRTALVSQPCAHQSQAQAFGAPVLFTITVLHQIGTPISQHLTQRPSP